MKKILSEILIFSVLSFLFPAITASGAVADDYVTPPGLVHITDVQSPSQLTAISGNVYFNGSSTQDGSQLWVTDGSADGTKEVGNSEGLFGVNPRNLTPWDGGVSFLGDVNGSAQIFTSDGTKAGTSFLNLTSAVAQPSSQLFDFANRLYFVDTFGYLASTDGSVAGPQRRRFSIQTLWEFHMA